MAEKGLKPALKAVAYVFAKTLCTILFVPFFRVRVVGQRNVPRKGGFLLAANHFSYVDPLILGTFMPRRLWFVMAEDQFVKPGLHGFSRMMDVVPVRAGAAFKLAPIRKCLTLLKHGRAVAIFPEGRRSKSGSLLPAMPGLGVLAARSGVPIVPVAIVGTRETYPVGQRFPRPGKVILYVGELIRPAEGAAAEKIADSAMSAIADLLKANGHEDYLGPDSQLLASEEDVREAN
jgi:1-acyl-sn-glycerol-3-phosphate acyltransferase